MKLLWVIVFMHCTQGSLFADASIKERVAMIPVEDQVELRDFFHGMLVFGEFADVLLGNKPAAFIERQWKFVDYNDSRIRERPFLTLRGYKIWKEYKYLFPNQKYVWVDQKNTKNCVAQWFIKKSSQKGLEDFLDVTSSFEKRENQLGSLLGYPKEDIARFCQRARLEKTIAFFPYKSNFLASSSCVFVKDLWSNIEQDPIEELARLMKDSRHKPFFSSEGPFFPIGSHFRFTAINSVRKKGEKWKMKIANLYNSENFLEDILTILEEDE